MNETQEFLSQLYAVTPKDWFVEIGLLQYRPTQEDHGAKRMRTRFFPVSAILDDWETVERELQYYNRKCVENVHFGVNPRYHSPARAGKNEDVSHYVALWGDVDFLGNETGVRKQFADALEFLKGKGLPPSCILESGHGLHAYWFLDQPYPVHEARPCCAGIQDVLKVADSIHDPRRLLRLPGFANLKDPKNPTWCRVVEASWVRYPLKVFLEFAIDLPAPDPAPAAPQPENCTFTMSRNPEIEKLKEGPVPEGERHNAAVRLAGHYCSTLRRKKLVLYAMNEWNAQKCTPPLPERELEQIVEDIWNKDQIRRANGKAEEPCGPRVLWFDEDGAFRPAIMAGWLCQQHNFISTPIGSDGKGITLYVYRNGAYRPDGCDFLRREIARLLGRDGKASRIEEVVYLVTEYSKLPFDQMNLEAKRLINCQNGMLDWKTGELLPHDPKYHSTVQVPVNWIPNAKSEKLDTFFGKILLPDEVKVLEEFVGYLLLPDTSMHRCMVFVGEGGNGKSTTLRLVVRLIGKENVSFFSLHSILEDRFTASGLVGKLVNFHDELETQALEKTGIFKQIVSGDPIKAEEKMKSPFWFRPFCRLVFATNQMPRANDRSQAYFDRLLFLPFQNRIRGTTHEIHDYDEVLANTPGVLEAFLVRAVEGLRRLQSTGKFSHSSLSDLALEEYRRECSSAYDFVRECLDQSNPASWVAKREVYERYKAWCGDSGRKPISDREFTKTLRLLGIKEARRGYARGWDGISWANDTMTSADEVKEFNAGDEGHGSDDF